MPDRLLNEIDTAQRLGFSRVSSWKRARRTGAVPPPIVEMPDGPRWSVHVLDQFLGIETSETLAASHEQIALERLRNGQGDH